MEQLGFKTAILALGYKAEQVVEYLITEKLEIEIIPIIESQPLGTGGAILKVSGLTRNDNLIVLNGDTLIRIESSDLEGLEQLHQELGAFCTLLVSKVEDASRFGTVTVQNGRVLNFSEKTSNNAANLLVNSGVMLVDAAKLKSTLFEKDGTQISI